MSIRLFFVSAFFVISSGTVTLASCPIGFKMGFWTQEQVKDICRRNNYCPTLNINGKQCSQFDPRISSAEKRRKNNAKKVDETTREIQNKLNGMGFQAGVADGLYGTKTKNALNQFYSSIGKTYDGKPSQNEIRDLNKYKGTNSFQLRRVKTAQHYLNALGFNAGAEDGVYGSKTERALQMFYSQQGKEYDGRLSANELEDLANYRITAPKRRKGVMQEMPKIEDEGFDIIEIDLTE